jgi:hypothetical protein
MKKKSIQITITEEKKKEWIEYALEKDFSNVSAFVKYAAGAFMRKYPSKRRKRDLQALGDK